MHQEFKWSYVGNFILEWKFRTLTCLNTERHSMAWLELCLNFNFDQSHLAYYIINCNKGKLCSVAFIWRGCTLSFTESNDERTLRTAWNLELRGTSQLRKLTGSFSEAAVKMITDIDFVHTLKVSTILHNKVEPLLSSLPLELASTYLDIKLLCMDTFF